MKLLAFSLASLAGLLLASAALSQEPWPYEYMRGEYVVPCPEKAEDSCVYHRLVVDNQSDDVLECRGQIAYSAVNRDGQTSKSHPSVVDAKSRKAVLSDVAAPDVNASSHGMNCKVRPRPDDSKLTPQCKPIITAKPTGSIDYSIESRNAGREGPVLLEFSFSDKDGAPTNIVVVGSSLWPELDASAVKYVGQYRGYTDCKQGRFRMPLTFKLRE
jgi:TonB family protein